jgi:low temperature requirement protein LtrA
VGNQEKSVTTFELFFDLVFVFAFIQVTALVTAQPDPAGLGRGLVVLALLWWAWAAYAWLTNAVDTSGTGPRTVLLGSMAAMLIVAVAVPTAFTDHAVVFAVAYVAVRALHPVLYTVTGQRAILRLAPGFAIAAALLILGALFSGWLQLGFWLAAIVIDYATPLVRGGQGFTLNVDHWAERHDLVVILALGETVIASGVGVVSAGERLTLPVIGVIVVAIGVIAGMWWAHFDGESGRTLRRIQQARGVAQIHLARDVHTYLHLALVGGIVVAAAGLESAMHHPLEPLSDIYPVALGGGAALFLLGLTAVRLRRGDRVRPEHLAGAGVAAGVVGLAYLTPAVVPLAVLGLVLFAVAVLDQRHDAARVRLRRHLTGNTGRSRDRRAPG